MYKIIKVVIESKRYELKDMLTKIDTFWVQGQLSEEEHTELVSLARENALPENSYASIQEQIDTLFKKVAEMEAEIASLKGTTSDTATEEYPEYTAPTGAHDAYYLNGAFLGDYTDYTEIVGVVENGLQFGRKKETGA